MTETPSPVSSPVPPPTDSTPRPKRSWTILGRLSQAVREQNWFAVVLEVLIVIVGVVVGFQVTGWGQARSDAAREQTYLRQLVVDLEASERLFAAADSFHASRVIPAASQLVSTFGHTPKPPADSVGEWFRWAWNWRPRRPVLGTARALVATGDLNLIRNDSLRSAILTYLDNIDTALERQGAQLQVADAAGYEITEHIDIPEWMAAALPDSTRERLSQSFTVGGLIPTGGWSAPFPLDTGAFYADRQAYASVFALALGINNFVTGERGMHRRTTALREEIERALDD